MRYTVAQILLWILFISNANTRFNYSLFRIILYLRITLYNFESNTISQCDKEICKKKEIVLYHRDSNKRPRTYKKTLQPALTRSPWKLFELFSIWMCRNISESNFWWLHEIWVSLFESSVLLVTDYNPAKSGWNSPKILFLSHKTNSQFLMQHLSFELFSTFEKISVIEFNSFWKLKLCLMSDHLSWWKLFWNGLFPESFFC